MRRSKAQMSLELIVLLSVLLAGFAVVLLVSNQSLSAAKSKLHHDQARLALDVLVENAERVYGQGVGAKQTILITLPETVNSTVLSGNDITINVLVRAGNIQEVYHRFPMNVSGSLPQTAGRHSITITSTVNGVVFS